MTTDENATNPVADDAVHDVAAEGVADEAYAQGDEETTETLDPTETEDGDEGTPDDEAEIEVDGQKYRVPKALEGAFLRNADYTKKTQEVAETRRAIEAERVALAQAAEAQKEYLADHVRVTKLQEMVEYYETVDWDRADDENPDVANREWRRFQQAQAELNTAKQELQTKEQSRLEAKQAETRKALQEAGQVLARDIPGWNQQLALKLVETAASYGVTHEELAGEGDKRVWVDPRVWKLFHAAHMWNQHQTKQANSERAKQAQTTAPIKTVGTKGAPVDPLSDRASIDVWMKARRNSVRKGR